jgi:hypothetical protein
MVDGYALDGLWAVYRLDGMPVWSVTHRPSGYSAGHVPSITRARQMVQALMRAVPVKHWRFKDGASIKDDPRFAGCKAIVQKYGC